DTLGGTVSLSSGGGVFGAQVDLVDCATDSLVARTYTLDGGAYGFDISNDAIRPGRYYATYRAARDTRVEGDTLPLERSPKDGEPSDGFDCEPRGGEGGGYVDEAREVGDLDVGGYCGRSAAYLEVGSTVDLLRLFERLEVKGGGSPVDLVGDKLAALPREGFWDVEFGEERWNLGTRQTASAQVYLTFPPDTTEEQLALGVPDNFDDSPVRLGIEGAVSDLMGSMYDGLFDIDGIVVTGGTASAGSAERRRRRALRGDPELGPGLRKTAGFWYPDYDTTWSIAGCLDDWPLPYANRADRPSYDTMEECCAGSYGGQVSNACFEGRPPEPVITYEVSARGTYRPPPYGQLGSGFEESINKDPDGLKNGLKERAVKGNETEGGLTTGNETEGGLTMGNETEGGLPVVFLKVQSSGARHLTVKKLPAVESAGPAVLDDTGGGGFDVVSRGVDHHPHPGPRGGHRVRRRLLLPVEGPEAEGRRRDEGPVLLRLRGDDSRGGGVEDGNAGRGRVRGDGILSSQTAAASFSGDGALPTPAGQDRSCGDPALRLETAAAHFSVSGDGTPLDPARTEEIEEAFVFGRQPVTVRRCRCVRPGVRKERREEIEEEFVFRRQLVEASRGRFAWTGAREEGRKEAFVFRRQLVKIQAQEKRAGQASKVDELRHGLLRIQSRVHAQDK
ncbi:hypothetical protein THAOC_09233, partial [Thalassiosira oceanica]